MDAFHLTHFLYLMTSLIQVALAQYFERIIISENIPVNTVVLNLKSALSRHTSDALKPNATAYAGEQETFWPFVLDDFVIKVGRPLDREALCAPNMTPKIPQVQTAFESYVPAIFDKQDDPCSAGVCCRLLHVNIMQSATDLPKVFYVQVVIQDVNDNAPIFPHINSPYAVVREDVSIEEPIWLPRALDADGPDFGVVEYRTENWLHGNQSHFKMGYSNLPVGKFIDRAPEQDMNLNRPYLKLTGPLDREKCDLYAFTLIAIDGGDRSVAFTDRTNRALSGSVNIVLQVKDVNDNPPEFNSPVYKAKLVENKMTLIVFEFEIVDKDIGDNGRVSVSIQDPAGLAQRLFRVSLQQKLNPTRMTTHVSRDAQTLKDTRYRGSLQLLSPIDAERYPKLFQFNLLATDFGQPSLSSKAEVRIEIINVNDNAPTIAFFSRGKRITDGRISLPEVKTPRGALVLLVHVTDDDSPVTLIRCQLVNGLDAFSLQEISGTVAQGYRSETVRGIVTTYRQFAIRTKRELDREEKSYYAVTVECTDSEGEASLSRNATLHVTVTDINDNVPQFDKSMYRARVNENAASTELQFTTPMRVTDVDQGPNALLVFSLFEVENDTLVEHWNETQGTASHQFRIDSRSGRIWTVVPLDCESQREYSLIVVARDSGTAVSHSSSAMIHVTVGDVNDNLPEFTHPRYAFQIIENAPSGTEIGRVEATDRDMTELNRRVRYALRGPVEDLHLISIDQHSGIVRSRRPIDRESRSSISLVVTAENEATLSIPTSWAQHNLGPGSNVQTSSEATLVINVLNVNDNRPEFSLIEPHKSHLTFIWEQLGTIQNNHTAESEHKQNQNKKTNNQEKGENLRVIKPTADLSDYHLSSSPVCERIPYRVTDKDFEPDQQMECCVLELLDDFDGLFYLMPEANNVLCVMRRPPTPKSYRLTLVAKDGQGNASMSAQVQFTVVIRSDPNLRLAEQSGTPMHLLARTASGSSNKRPTVDSWTGGNRGGNEVKARMRYSSGPSDNGRFGGPLTQHTIIIIVMVSVSGILCMLLIMAILFTRRCIVEGKLDLTKDDQALDSDRYIDGKDQGSIHSSPSRSQSCSIFQMGMPRNPTGSDFYAPEMVYRHPLRTEEQTYEMAIRQTPDGLSFVSPSLKRGTPRPVVYTGPILLPTDGSSNPVSRSTTPSNLDTLQSRRPPSASGKMTTNSQNSGTCGCRPPIHPGQKTLRKCYGANRVVANNTTTSRAIDMGNLYQTIDSRILGHLHIRPQSETLPLISKQTTERKTTPSGEHVDAVKTYNRSAELTDLTFSPNHKRLQRSNSERSNIYQQTSFV